MSLRCRIRVVAASVLLAVIPAVACHASDVTDATRADATGAGATFPQPLYVKWGKVFQAETGSLVTYAGTGSGDGVKQVAAGSVDFGGSDMPLAPAELSRLGLVQFPTVIGGVLPVVNLDGVDPGGIVVDGPTLAAIFSGRIMTWDDAAIARTNPGLILPHVGIVVVHRSDASGTTFVLTDYLGKVGTAWRSRIGAGTTVDWPVGVAAKGSDGMVQTVLSTSGSLGYVEYAYAKRAGLSYLNLVNADGRVIQPTPMSFAAASSAVDWSSFAKSSDKSLTNEPGGAAWPITTATFVLFKMDGPRPEAAAAALRMFDWAFNKGASITQDLDYVPLPDEAVEAARKTWRAINTKTAAR